MGNRYGLSISWGKGASSIFPYSKDKSIKQDKKGKEEGSLTGRRLFPIFILSKGSFFKGSKQIYLLTKIE